MSEPYYITTPIYYVNGEPHIGHAYTTISCDVIARFMRLDGRRVFFLTGTDEHGQKVEASAAAAGMAPIEFCDAVSAKFRHLTQALDISNDDFIRTTEPRHIRSCQALWRRLMDAGVLYLGAYAGWYAARDETFYTEGDLIDGRAPTGAPVAWVEEPSYFFRLSEWQDRLLAFYEANPDFLGPETRLNEVLSFVRGGLKDLSVSRTSFSWGVPVPREAPGDDRHIMYVWLDALTNYITALGYPETGAEMFETFWPANLHVVGKEIIRFHAVYWPAFLMAAGLPVPRRIYAHGWWTSEGLKISKSLGNAVEPLDLVARYGLDPIRYFLLRAVPFGQDGDFSRRAVYERINADLANNLGNLVQRVLSQVQRNCGAVVPAIVAPTETDHALLGQAQALLPLCRDAVGRQQIHVMLDAIWALFDAANRYVDAEAPWALKKTDPARMATVLAVLVETIRVGAILIQPVMPGAAARILDQLGVAAEARDFTAIGAEGSLAGTSLAPPTGVFPRLDPALAAAS